MLIADDDPAIVRLLADRCVKMGFKVETATNGMQLLVKARRSQPDIIIVDVNMPELDGLSVCTRLLDPGSKPLEVVVVTGSNDPETRRTLRKPRHVLRPQGPDFWNSVEGALAEIYPDLAGQIGALEMPATDAEVPQRPRVLVVDDDPDIEKFLASRLEQIRHRHALCPRRRAGLPRSPARKSRPSSSPTITCPTATPSICCTGCAARR